MAYTVMKRVEPTTISEAKASGIAADLLIVRQMSATRIRVAASRPVFNQRA